MLSFKHRGRLINNCSFSLTSKFNLGSWKTKIFIILGIQYNELINQLQTMIPKQNNRLVRFNSDQIRTPERKVLMYSVDEEVTFLIDENQVERVMSQNSDSDYMIQTIEEETDVSEWQVIDHKHLLTSDQKKILNSLQEMRNLFNSKSKHSHQIQQALKLFL